MQIVMTPKVVSFFAERKVYFDTKGGNRFLDGEQIVRYDKTLNLEPYVGVFKGCHIQSIGSYSYLFGNFPTNTKIGRYCSIAACKSMSTQHPTDRFITSSLTYDKNLPIFNNSLQDSCNDSFQVIGRSNINQPIIIENDVWIGENAVIRQGVHIGNGAIVATGAVVTKNVPAYAVVGGVPAVVKKMRFPDAVIEELIDLKWWEYNFADFRNMRSDISIFHFIGRIQEDIKRGTIHKYKPQVITAKDLEQFQ